jgi:hypothetical protein
MTAIIYPLRRVFCARKNLVLLYTLLADIFLTLETLRGREVQERRVYDARVEEVHSGDDFILLVELGVDNLFKKIRARLHGVDAPNAYRAGPDTEAGVVRDEVRAMCAQGKCRISVVSEGKGGWVVRLYVQSGEQDICVNDVLRDKGYIFASQKQE